MAMAYIGLGSNLGDREATLRAALGRLRAHPHIEVTAESRLIETAPVGGPPGQPAFLNGAAAVETDLEPHALLDALKETERALGRRPRERWGPREIDLDLLLYGDRIVETDRLTVPHPRLSERRFALGPLAEIAPDARDPVTGRTVRAMLAALDGAAP
jgi:2-amino-4-hydroxy-6-hydroxymethyldihydropteridine diphosphokinase